MPTRRKHEMLDAYYYDREVEIKMDTSGFNRLIADLASLNEAKTVAKNEIKCTFDEAMNFKDV